MPGGIVAVDTPMRARIRQSALISAGLALTLASLGGCVIGDPEGGNRASTDKHVYVSYPYEPKTVSLIDTRNDEVLWTAMSTKLEYLREQASIEGANSKEFWAVKRLEEVLRVSPVR
ncbi:MAG: hypothetical protein IH804_06725 [Planctomycetes bacterium]|nr:hypothetical protein [Planctomycetota bacterium]